MNYAKLFEKGKIGNVEIKNRVVLPPMGVGLADASGKVNNDQLAYFEAIAKGGVGLITSSCIAVDDEYCGYVEPGQVSFVKPDVFDGVKELVDCIHKHDSKIVFQLLHPGRQASSQFNNGQQPVGPSAIKEADYLEMPRALTTEEVQRLITKFIDGATFAYDAGADGIELHGAHGYLIHQFMSPRANQRTDQYGGNFENRMRFVSEIAQGILAIKPENTFLAIRINAADLYEGGLTQEDCIQIAKHLEKVGFDALSLSCGTYLNALRISEPAPYPEECRTPLITPIKETVSIPVIAVNHIRRPQTAEKILQEGICDFVALGRPLLADHEFVNKTKDGKEDRILTCISCCNCVDAVQGGGAATCSVNPYLAKESIYNEDTIVKNGNGRKVVVIGGGPGGMQAAIIAAQRGFDVVLFDKNKELGGALLLASKGTGKDKVAWAVDGFVNQMKDLDIEVQLDTKITSLDKIKALNPYAVVVAIGGTPMTPPIPGLDRENVLLAHDLLASSEVPQNKRVALIGSGMTGLETAEVLLEGNNKITIYDMLDEIAKGANLSNKLAVMDILSQGGTEFKTLHKLKEVTADGVILENMVTGENAKEDFDLVVLSLGVKPDKSLTELFENNFENVISIGDCAGGTKIVDATREGLEKMWQI